MVILSMFIGAAILIGGCALLFRGSVWLVAKIRSRRFAVEGPTESMNVTYGLAGWSEDQRARLTRALDDAGVAYKWDGVDLVVERRFEGTTDGFVYGGTPND
jgi:hypothetical protein